jgi:twitching motility protein PilJ
MSDTPWFKSSLWLPTLVALGLILLALSSALLAVGGRLQQQDRQYLQTVGSLQRVAAALPAAASAVAAGDTLARARVSALREESAALLARLGAGDRVWGLVEAPGARLVSTGATWPVMLERMQAFGRPGQRTLAEANEISAASVLAGNELAELARSSDPGILAGPYPALIAMLLSMVSLAGALFAWISTADMRRDTELQSRQNQKNQEAILRLLDEMSSLADGDLTVQATVTNDITAAIADAVNYAIEALRDLVTTINETAVQLDSAARQTQAAADHLAKASIAQSRQVAEATEAVTGMAGSIEQVSTNAERCSQVARHAVEISHKGGDAVRRTIDGMNAIRENIQDTSKRIKRLGESSQEIGNIVELINDIAEQTNILALNASIQASMAGEAGRGFAVVADEVQRLAERAGHATRQIEVLVRTIQGDTNEAVVSMERTTTDVVGGALLAENAGAALGEIEAVSNQIAELVQGISGSARQQAAASGQISRTMQVLREISQQTADNTHATSGAIGRLASLSAQLRRAAQGFRVADAELPPGATRVRRSEQQAVGMET